MGKSCCTAAKTQMIGEAEARVKSIAGEMPAMVKFRAGPANCRLGRVLWLRRFRQSVKRPSGDRGVRPDPCGPSPAAARFVSVRSLKLEVDQLKKHEDELDFFALELQSRRVSLGPWKGLPVALYGAFSDYGRSYVWPFLWLFAVMTFGAAIFRHFGALTLGEASGLSAANTFNVFGFRKDFIASSVTSGLSPWLEVVTAVQTILGTILLFLFGLGIRNKFRMK
jgi:hypothetical protein